jgi:hypothetical protein
MILAHADTVIARSIGTAVTALQNANARKSSISKRAMSALSLVSMTTRRFSNAHSPIAQARITSSQHEKRIIHLFIQADDANSIDDSLQIFAGQLLDDEVPS